MRHVFISYSHQDNDFAQLLRTELQNAGIPTWLALENIKPGEDWKSEIDDSIKNSFALLIIISPASDLSKYVTYEWALAYGFGIPIIPILYRQLEFPQKPHPRLESLQYEDFTINVNRPWQRVIDRLIEIQAEAIRKEQEDPKIREAIQALDNWDSATIVRAAGMLGKRKIQSAIPKLDQLLDEPESDIQIASIKALGEIGSSQQVDKIISLVEKLETRASAIECLGKIGDARAEAVLIRYLNSRDERTRTLCVNALKNISSPNSKKALLMWLQNSASIYTREYEDEGNFDEEWDDDFEDREPNELLASVFASLSDHITNDDIPQLIKISSLRHLEITIGSIKLLGQLQVEGTLNHLLDLSKSRKHTIREAAFQAIEQFTVLRDFRKMLEKLSVDKSGGYAESIDFFYEKLGLRGLLYLLAYPNSKAYWHIAAKMEKVTNDSDLDLLVSALQDPAVHVRALTADVIGRKRMVALCEKLRPLVDDSSSFVRGLAIRAIGDLRCRRVLTALKKRLKDTKHVFSDSNTEVRDFAAIALAKLGNKSALSRLQELILISETNLREEATDLLISLEGNLDNERFEASLNSNDPQKRVAALKILTVLEKKLDWDQLVTAMGSSNDKERSDAIEQLSELYTPLGLIIALSVDYHNFQAYWDISAKLEKLLEPEHSSLINQFIFDGHFLIRAFLAKVIGERADLNLGQQLLRLLDDEITFVKGLAIQALGNLQVESAKENLSAYLHDETKIFSNSEDRVCDYAAVALVSIERKMPKTILNLLRKNPSYISQELIELHRASPLEVEDGLADELSQMLLMPEITESLASSIISLLREFGSAKDAHMLLDYLASGQGKWLHVGSVVEKLADRTIKSRVLSLLDIENQNLRMVCLDILKIYGDHTVINKVLSLLNENQGKGVIIRALDVLAAFGDVSLIDKISSFQDSELDHIRSAVARAYGKLKDHNSLARIVPFLSDEAYIVRADAVKALIELDKPESLESILNGMDIWANPNDDYFKSLYDVACLEAIGKFGNEEHIGLLRDVALKHDLSDCRAAAIYALDAQNDNEIVDLLINKLSDRDYASEYNDSVCNIAAKIMNTIDQKKAKDALKEWISNLPEDERPDFNAMNNNIHQ